MPSTAERSAGDNVSLPSIIILDACVVLNLCSTGRIEDILRRAQSRFLISSHAQREALWYDRAAEGRGPADRHHIDYDALIASGLIEVAALEGREQEVFIELAGALGDGEAASGALAVGRIGVVATDDRKARQVFRRREPPIATIGTVALLQAWERSGGTNLADIGAALLAIEVSARFHPSPDDADYDWWCTRRDAFE